MVLKDVLSVGVKGLEGVVLFCLSGAMVKLETGSETGEVTELVVHYGIENLDGGRRA